MTGATVATPSEKDVIQTTDLTLATYLIVEGCEPRLVRDGTERMPNGDPKVGWQFRKSETIESLIDEYKSDEALVEPQAFHKTLSATRRSAFVLMKEGEGR